jgi:hypothetical protein
MLEQADEHAAQMAVERDRIGAESAARGQALQQEQQNQSAALALRQQALKQAGILGTDRNQNQSNAFSARQSLEEANRKKPTLINTGNGLFKFDPATGRIEKVPGTTKPQTELVPTYIPPVDAKEANITPASSGSWNPFNWGAGAHPAITNSPASDAIPGHWYNKRVPVDDLVYTAGQDAGGGAIALPNAEVNQGPTPSAADALQPLGGGMENTSGPKMATADVILNALKMSGGDKESARQSLQDAGYTIPPAQ